MNKTTILQHPPGDTGNRKQPPFGTGSDTAVSNAVPLVHKMWILPDGTVQPLIKWHWSWLQANPDVYQKFRIKGDASKMDEGMGRRLALQAGFFRLNYEKGNGHLTIEGCQKFLSRKHKDAITLIVHDNAQKIDHITLNLFDPEVKRLEKTATHSIFRHRNEDKSGHIPFISDSAQGKALRLLLKNDGGRPRVTVATQT